MPTVHESMQIARPVKDVFQFATNPDNQMLWNSNMTSYASDGPPQKGTRSRGSIKVAGRQVDWTSEITEFDPFRTLVFRSIEAPMAFSIEMTFEDVTNHDTVVTFHQEVESLGGFFGKLSDPLVTRMYSHDVRANLEHLRELLEGQ